jgi:hypothetical protein
MMQERGAQAGQRLDDQWETPRQVIARAAVQPYARAILAGDDPETVVLDLMQPQPTRRRFAELLWGGTGR